MRRFLARTFGDNDPAPAYAPCTASSTSTGRAAAGGGTILAPGNVAVCSVLAAAWPAEGLGELVAGQGGAAGHPGATVATWLGRAILTRATHGHAGGWVACYRAARLGMS
jgi:hypothetical protein